MINPRAVTLPAGKVEYYEYGSADAPPILFIHGVLVNHHLWEQVCPSLANDYRCIVPTWPLGAHTQPLNADADVSPEGMVEIIVSFMDALQLERATLVGNDSGGALCQMMVERHPQRIARLVLTSCDAYELWLPRLFKYLEFAAFIPGMLWLLGADNAFASSATTAFRLRLARQAYAPRVLRQHRCSLGALLRCAARCRQVLARHLAKIHIESGAKLFTIFRASVDRVVAPRSIFPA